jgi:hypothetical protein
MRLDSISDLNPCPFLDRPSLWADRANRQRSTGRRATGSPQRRPRPDRRAVDLDLRAGDPASRPGAQMKASGPGGGSGWTRSSMSQIQRSRNEPLTRHDRSPARRSVSGGPGPAHRSRRGLVDIGHGATIGELDRQPQRINRPLTAAVTADPGGCPRRRRHPRRGPGGPAADRRARMGSGPYWLPAGRRRTEPKAQQLIG